MKTRIGIAFVLVALAAGVHFGWSSVSAQAPNDEILPGCGIPRSYGRLVSMMPGASNGAAGSAAKAVFEAEDGTVRLVDLVSAGLTPTQASPSRSSTVRPAFMANYHCTLSSEWKRH